MPITSAIYSKLQYDEKEPLVFLMNKKGGQHAFLVLESVEGMFKADFIMGSMDGNNQFPEDDDFSSKGYLDSGSASSSKVSSAPVLSTTRSADSKDQKSSNATNVSSNTTMSVLTTGKIPGLARFTPLNVPLFASKVNSHDFKYWRITKAQYDGIRADIAKDVKDSPPYKLSGGRRFFEEEGAAFNCTTWAEKILKNRGLKLDSIWLDYVLIAKPSKRFKPSCVIA